MDCIRKGVLEHGTGLRRPTKVALPPTLNQGLMLKLKGQPKAIDQVPLPASSVLYSF
jgi:hypothetical protein